ARLGILVDGAGIGSAMAANKVPGVRAAPCTDEAAARNAREHNDANVLTLGSKFVDATRMQAIVEAFLTTHCTEERHARRVGKIKAIEDAYLKEPKRQ
ncbi:MAG TPA: RpiB/LacA/LacB family sugar-phosphate isomerase, partial [Vicinamibacteria bacterium]|nr:RpiB/LacA/LacB family sugar-phosphate isomerase [Vicinamibacteria bacterium]